MHGAIEAKRIWKRRGTEGRLYNTVMGALPVTKFSVEEYLALDRAAEIPSEYHDGEIFPLAATSWEHNLLHTNLCWRLGERLFKSPCHAAGSSIRVRTSPTKFVIPDIAVVCGKPALTDEYQDTLTNPKVIVEILSPSTADYDYGGKFIQYRQLESFEEYVLVAQDQPRVEVFRKTSGSRWIINTYEGLEAVAAVETLSISLPLIEIYSGIEFPALS